MAIDVTPGGIAADSYVNVADADAYFATRLFTPAWDAATTDEKERALKWATRILDSVFTWQGVVASTLQALGFPRTGIYSRNGVELSGSTIPQALKDATAEFAHQLLTADRTVDNDVARQGITKLKAGPVELSFRDDLTFNASTAVIPDAVLLLIPAAWYTPAKPAKLAIFETL